MADHSQPVGADIHTHCTRCKGDRWHVIVAKVGSGSLSRIKRVECKTCGSLHNLREAKEDRAHKRTSSGSRKKKAQTRTQAIRSAGGHVSKEPWQKLVNDREAAGEERRSYNIRQTYDVGNLIDHPKFGIGVVLKILDNNQKVEIAFKEGTKLLIQGRA